MLSNIGLPGLLILALIVLVLFGRGKVANLMGEVGKGISSFRKGMNEGKDEAEKEKLDSAKDVTPHHVPNEEGTTQNVSQDDFKKS